MTASKLAEEAGVAASTITRIEKEDPRVKSDKDKAPRYDTIKKIAEALGMRIDEIAWPGDPLGLEE